MTTKIEWTERTWNPITGCSRVSEGCKNCYAEKMTRRLEAMGSPKYRGILNEHGRFNGGVRFDESALLVPLKRKKPTTYFVNSMSDLFHENIADEWIDKVFAVMALAPQHTFQMLSKRAKRMREYVNWKCEHLERRDKIAEASFNLNDEIGANEHGEYAFSDSQCFVQADRWPLPNVHLGVSAENQEQADARIPDLLETPAAVRFVSAEPLLGEIDFSQFLPNPAMCGFCGFVPYEGMERFLQIQGDGVTCIRCTQPLPSRMIDQIIVGGESGPNARPCNVDWIRSIVNQCQTAGVAVFVKQLGSGRSEYSGAARIQPVGDGKDAQQGTLVYKHSKGADPSEWPEDLRIREFPKEAK
ncbi:MAG TPA: phage Gp37/Gp68 family protein [Pyrinomonadaceae bacterium]|nr:phage Gp37/Gp68 family protein [Pyrinomonadaceae bacterium]